MALVASGCGVALVASGCGVAVVASGCGVAVVASGCGVALVASGCGVAVVASGDIFVGSLDHFLHLLCHPFAIRSDHLGDLCDTQYRVQLRADLSDQPVCVVSPACCTQRAVDGYKLAALGKLLKEPTVAAGAGAPFFDSFLRDLQVVGCDGGGDGHVALHGCEIHNANAK